jgi:protein phosphatase
MEPDTFEFDGENGDRLLLCSDGLTGMLTDAQIEAILASNADLDVAARALVDAANAAGGQDNISVVIVELEGRESTDARERSGRTRAWLAVLGWIAAFALVVAAIGYGTYRYAQNSYFLTSEEGVVVIYRGVPGTLGTWDLKWQLERTNTPVQLLSTNLQQRLDEGVRAESLEDARRLAASYREQVERSLGTTLPPAPGGY